MTETLEELETPPGDETAEDEPDDEPTPGDEPTPEHEPTPAPEPVQLSEKEIEKAWAKLEAEAKRHAGRVSEIMGADALDLVVCELCEPAIPGFHWPVAAMEDDDPRRAMLAAVGAGDLEGYAEAPDAEPCSTCNARGKVRTGSLVPDQETKLCPDCQGQGWKHKTTAPPPAPLAAGEAHEPTGQVREATHQNAPDFLGRPFGHPNYGKLQQYLTETEAALDARDGYGS